MASLIGQIFSSLTVVSDTGKREHKKVIYACKCVCGNTIAVRGASLVSGNTKSCGCLSYRPTVKHCTKTSIPAASLALPRNFNYYQDIIKELHAIRPELLFYYDKTSKNTDILVCDTTKVAVHFIDLATKNQEHLMKNLSITQVEAKKFISGIMDEYTLKGFRVITIFENEWDSKKYKILNFLKSVMGCNNVTVFARKCYAKKIDKVLGRSFFKTEHIQGPANLSTEYYGLFEASSNELIEAVSFGHHHREQSIFSNSHTSVLDRLAVKSGYNIPGGASKLLKFAIADLKTLGKTQIVSWSDKRISAGNLYKVLGFTLHQELNPDYCYWDSVSANPLSVLGKQANKKCNLIVNGTPVLQTTYTEYEATLLLGRFRIWDCGKSTWTMSLV